MSDSRRRKAPAANRGAWEQESGRSGGRASEYVRAIEASGGSERWFRNIFEKSPISINLYDSRGRFLDANDACLEMFGVSRAQLVMKQPPLLADRRLSAEVKRQLRAGHTVRYEGYLDFDKGRSSGLVPSSMSGGLYVDVMIAPFGMDDEARVTGYLLMIQDITKRRQAEDAMRDLSRGLVELQETERKRIASELHDEVGQALTGLKISLATAASLASEKAWESLRGAEEMLNEVMTRVHNLTLELRPVMLDDLGLLPTVRWHLDHYTASTGVKARLEHAGAARRCSPRIELAAYRILQEALTNVARHAGVQAVTVRMLFKKSILTVQVEDHGVGFEPGSAKGTGSSYGLIGMRERADSVGGRLDIDSAAGTGTRVTATFPLKGGAQ